MDKDNIIKIAVREMQELELLAKHFSDKVDNLKRLIELLEDNSQKANETKSAPIAEKKAEMPKKNILADTIKTTSLNEKMSGKTGISLDQALGNKKITDLKRSISLNDKFRFQREIFGGNATLLNQTLETLNEIDSKEKATEFLSNLNFDNENPTAAEFLELVNRKF